MDIKRKIADLAMAFKGDDDVLEIIEKDVGRFNEYVSAVSAMEYQIPIIYARYEGQDVRDRIMALDNSRKNAHDMAIAAVKRLNRFSKMVGLPELFAGDTDDRYAVADFCGEVVSELFEEGINPHHYEQEEER